MNVSIIHVAQREDHWRYVATITEIDDENLSHFHQLIYDRVHNYPTKISDDSGSYEDLLNNLTQRAKTTVFSKRELPRINVNRFFETKEGFVVTLLDFNYRYATLQVDAAEAPVNLIVNVGHGVELVLIKEDSVSDKHLYEVHNWKDIVANDAAIALVYDWAGVDEPSLHEKSREKEYAFN